MAKFGNKAMNSEMLLAERIRQCAQMVGSGDELARQSGIPRRTLENYLSGKSEPKASALVAIAKCAGVSLDWLIAGGEKAANTFPSTLHSGSAIAIDEELHGRVVDGIARLYKAEHVSLQPIDLGRLAARMYADIANAGLTSQDEQLAALRFALEQLRRQLRTPPDNGKSHKRLA